jgi:hypothetical protein
MKVKMMGLKRWAVFGVGATNCSISVSFFALDIVMQLYPLRYMKISFLSHLFLHIHFPIPIPSYREFDISHVTQYHSSIPLPFIQTLPS